MPFHRGSPRQRIYNILKAQEPIEEEPASDDEQEYDLADAIVRGDTAEVAQKLSEGYRVTVNWFNDGDYRSLLSIASMCGELDIITLLVDKGADINDVNDDNRSSLFLAADKGQAAAVAKLLQFPNIKVNVLDKDGRTPLMKACENGHTDVVRELLLHKSIDVNLANDHGDTALMFTSNVDILRMMLDYPGIHSVNLQDSMGNSVLNYACFTGYEDVVRHLLTLPEILVNYENTSGNTALQHACEYGFPNIAVLLMQWPHIDVNYGKQTGRWSLIEPCKRGQSEVVRLMVQHKNINVNVLQKGDTPMHVALKNGHVDIVEILLTSPTLIFDSRDDFGNTPLAFCINNRKLPIALKFLELRGNDIPLVHREKLVLEHVASVITVQAALTMLLRDMPFQVISGVVHAVETHSYSWTTFLDSSIGVDPNVRVETIQNLLEHEMLSTLPLQELVHFLAHCKDQNGRNVLHTTDSMTRDYLKGINLCYMKCSHAHVGMLHFCGRYEIFTGPPIHISPTSIVVNAYDHSICSQVFQMHVMENGQLNEQGFISCSRILGRLSTERNAVNTKVQREVARWKREFQLWDKDSNGNMSEDEFLRYCAQYFGGKVKVAMKFMRNLDEYEREIASRQGIDSLHVLNTLPSVEQDVFHENVSSLKINGTLSIDDYPNVLVMPAADRSLEDIYLKERPDESHVRSLLHEIALALRHIHQQGLIHGDLKKLNILRVQNQLKLIDLDAATRIGKPLGAKFSSGNFPPEMFHVLQGAEDRAAYEAHWSDKNLTKEQLAKLKPKDGVVVKTFHNPKDVGGLPYKLIAASPAADMWAFGCIIYQMCSGVELVPTDINQDVVSDRMKMAATWQSDKLRKRLAANISDESVLDLLTQLLAIDPDKRLSIDSVLIHPYFTCVTNLQGLEAKIETLTAAQREMQERIEKLTATVKESTRLQEEARVAMQAQLLEAKQSVLCGVMEASDVIVPTSFVVLPYKIGEEAPHEATQFKLERMNRLVQTGKSLMNAVKEGESIDDALATFTKDSIYLYLIDESTCEIIENDLNGIYPFEIRSNAAFLATAMPLIQGGMSMVKKFKGLETILDIAGLSIVSDDIRSAMDELDEAMENAGSSCSFKALEKAMPGVPVERIRGAALRELTRIYEQYDEDRTFCGLDSVVLANGHVIWTNAEDATMLRAEKRKGPKTLADMPTFPVRKTLQDLL